LEPSSLLAGGTDNKIPGERTKNKALAPAMVFISKPDIVVR
jgi:hypothetical protein